MAASGSASAGDGLVPLIATRGYNGIHLLAGSPAPSAHAPFKVPAETDSRAMTFSKTGELFAYVVPSGVHVVEAKTGKERCVLPRPRTVELLFSPQGTFLATWEPYAVRKSAAPQSEEALRNLNVWSTASGDLVFSLIEKRREVWQPQWSDDEAVCARNVSNEIHFFDGRDLGAGIKSKLHLPGVAKFSLSPGPSPQKIAAFIPSSKGMPATVRIYQGPTFDVPVLNKSFFKADKVTMSWNSTGSAVLVSSQTDVDKSNQSYYGETSLYYLSVATNVSVIVQLDKEGPIYDAAWSPDGNEFVAVYGFMPARATLYDSRCEKVFDFGSGPRSTASFSPKGNIICLAGFGNLRGDVEFWSRKDLKLVSKMQAPDSTVFSWCPDSRHILTATTAPRLKVDNGYKIWHYTKGEVFHEGSKELFDAQWQPMDSSLFPERPISPVPAATKAAMAPEAKKAVYRPPGARGKASTFKLHEVEGPSNPTKTQAPLSKAAIKNKKKREAKARAAAEESTTPGLVPKKQSDEQRKALETTKALLQPAAAASAAAGPEKKLRNLNKKLRQIEQLKERQAAGDELQPNQVEKISTEDALKAEIAELEKEIAAGGQ